MYDDLAPFSWVSGADLQNTNYNYITLDKIKNAPKKWLCSLPIFEFAHLSCLITALRMGGEPTRFIDDLYNNQLNPIVSEYHKKLAKYRFIRALYLRKYESMKPLITGKYLQDAIAEIKKETVEARRKIREACAKYEETH